MEVTDKIREAFEKWQSEHDPRQYPAERQAFSAGYQAAFDSLEQVGYCHMDSKEGADCFQAWPDTYVTAPVFVLPAPSPDES